MRTLHYFMAPDEPGSGDDLEKILKQTPMTQNYHSSRFAEPLKENM